MFLFFSLFFIFYLFYLFFYTGIITLSLSHRSFFFSSPFLLSSHPFLRNIPILVIMTEKAFGLEVSFFLSFFPANPNQQQQPTGKVLGGSSILNYMQYVRGHPSDYDKIDLPGSFYFHFHFIFLYFYFFLFFLPFSPFSFPLQKIRMELQ